jgi:hypothetical protein
VSETYFVCSSFFVEDPAWLPDVPAVGALLFGVVARMRTQKKSLKQEFWADGLLGKDGVALTPAPAPAWLIKAEQRLANLRLRGSALSTGVVVFRPSRRGLARPANFDKPNLRYHAIYKVVTPVNAVSWQARRVQERAFGDRNFRDLRNQ